MSKIQKESLQKVNVFIKSSSLDNPDLTHIIWGMINDKNNQKEITHEESKKYSENWSMDLVGELQRTLVNYQLRQLKMNRSPPVFSMIKVIFSRIENNLSLLDIGCTTGYYYEVINHYFPNKFNYSGCDYNESSIKLAKKYYQDIDFSVKDLTKMNCEGNSYDVTFLSGVIEHIPDYVTAIKELCRITKKYIVLHRIWLTNNETICKKGTQYFVPVIRNQYNSKDFFNLFKNKFEIIFESNTFDGNCKSYILKCKNFD